MYFKISTQNSCDYHCNITEVSKKVYYIMTRLLEQSLEA